MERLDCATEQACLNRCIGGMVFVMLCFDRSRAVICQDSVWSREELLKIFRVAFSRFNLAFFLERHRRCSLSFFVAVLLFVAHTNLLVEWQKKSLAFAQAQLLQYRQNRRILLSEFSTVLCTGVNDEAVAAGRCLSRASWPASTGVFPWPNGEAIFCLLDRCVVPYCS